MPQFAAPRCPRTERPGFDGCGSLGPTALVFTSPGRTGADPREVPECVKPGERRGPTPHRLTARTQRVADPETSATLDWLGWSGRRALGDALGLGRADDEASAQGERGRILIRSGGRS